MSTAGGARGPGPQRAWAPTLGDAGAKIVLDVDESSHLVRSRRVVEGTEVVLFDGTGGCVVGTLSKADPRAAEITVEAPYPVRAPAVALTVAVSLPEAGRSAFLVAALAEVGVYDIVPMTCARTPKGRHAPARLASRAKRWAKITRESAKVSGAARCMGIGEAQPFASLLADDVWMLDTDPRLPRLAAWVGTTPRARATVLVGPEGGFTDEEVAAAEAAGATRLSLGACALRVTTAALAASALVLGATPPDVDAGTSA